MRKSSLCVLGLVVAILAALGLVVLYSASEVRGELVHGNRYYFVIRQAVYILLGIAIAVVVARFDYRNLREHPALAVAFCAAVLISLALVFLFPAVKGSHRWIVLGPVKFQPGEFAKIAVVVGVLVHLERTGWQIGTWRRGLIVPMLIIGAIAGLVLIEPDFGSTCIVMAAGALAMLLGGVRWAHIGVLALIGCLLIGFTVIHNPNRVKRMAAKYPSVVKLAERFGGAGADAAAATKGADNAAGYQSEMSLVAIGRGGLWGVGLQRSMQKRNYLPEAWTDFIFAVGAEELGLVFSLSVVGLYLLFAGLSIYIALHAADRFGRNLAVCMMAIVFFQAVFNLSVVCDAFITKGVALPLFSYGGTNILSTFAAIGLIFSVGSHAQLDKRRTLLRRPPAGGGDGRQ